MRPSVAPITSMGKTMPLEMAMPVMCVCGDMVSARLLTAMVIEVEEVTVQAYQRSSKRKRSR